MEKRVVKSLLNGRYYPERQVEEIVGHLWWKKKVLVWICYSRYRLPPISFSTAKDAIDFIKNEDGGRLVVWPA